MTNRRTSQRTALLKPTVVNSILEEVRSFQDGGGRPISLMRGQPDLPTPAHIVAAANAALAAGRTSYPNNLGEPALRAAVAQKLQRSGGGQYSPDDEILITSGATLGLYAALAAVLDPGDEVLLPEPIYDAYLGVIAYLGGIARSIPAPIVDGRFAIDGASFAAACGVRTRVLLINTPWNPTGSVLRRDELESLMTFAAQRDLIVISDEIYEAIIFDGREHVSPASISREARNRTIVVNSFSKTYAMTGWRLGYCAGPADLIGAMYRVLQQSSRGPATFVQDAGLAALEGSQECVRQMSAEYATRRGQVCDALGQLPGVRLLLPEAGFFAILDVRELQLPSDQLRRRLLEEFGVVVVHGAAYGPSAEGTLRVSFASGGQNLTGGLERLQTGLQAIAEQCGH
jgi:aspartate/methionine/tyrosine aminotransferase